MKNIMNKNEKGITLIALVITIIVLLILAGVAISMLSGENGIINRATEAKTETANAERDESEKLTNYETIIDDKTGGNANNTLEELNLVFKDKIVMNCIGGSENDGLTLFVGDTVLTLVDDESMKIKDNLIESDFVAGSEVVLGGIIVNYNDKPYTVIYGADENYDYTGFTYNSSYGSSFYGINPVILRVEEGHKIIGNDYVR